MTSGTPALTAPVVGSDIRSELLCLSLTKYGPSVSDGVTTHDAFVDVDDEEDEGDVGELLEPHPRNPTATTDPNAYKTSRRPTANSSESFMIPLPLLRVLPRLAPGNARLAGNVDARLKHCESRRQQRSDLGIRRLFVTVMSGSNDRFMKISLLSDKRETAAKR